MTTPCTIAGQAAMAIAPCAALLHEADLPGLLLAGNGPTIGL